MVRGHFPSWHFWNGTTSTRLGRFLRNLGLSLSRRAPSRARARALTRPAAAAQLPQFGRKFPDQAAAHQPGERLNEEIPGIVLLFFPRPFPHREMTHQHDVPFLEERETRRPMRQPADVFRRPAQQRAVGGHQTAIRRGIHWFDKRKDNALRGMRLKKLILGRIDEISDEKSAACLRPGRARRKEPVPAQRPVGFDSRAITVQVRRGERSNPSLRRGIRTRVRRRVRRDFRMGFRAHPA
jgi:hypothetical protein